MKQSIKEELLSYSIETIKDLDLDIDNEELHFHLFNEDYYLIGYYNCSQWLKKHNLGEFEALEELQEMQEMHFGGIQKIDINSETVVNQLVYFYGLELMEDIIKETKLN